jgi:hypothetical protein
MSIMTLSISAVRLRRLPRWNEVEAVGQLQAPEQRIVAEVERLILLWRTTLSF